MVDLIPNDHTRVAVRAFLSRDLGESDSESDVAKKSRLAGSDSESDDPDVLRASARPARFVPVTTCYERSVT